MGIETKKMTKSMAAAEPEDNLGARVASWPEKIKTFYNDVRTEMKKVTNPSMKEVQATTVVVIITVFIFGLYFWLVDLVIGRGIDFVFRSLGHS
ncbi:MAG TPA: preprotein translocase subunit SecE [Terriglobales bacterium]|nr:preprotein translocase subunit SecE [Terriglobales bacterium]